MHQMFSFRTLHRWEPAERLCSFFSIFTYLAIFPLVLYKPSIHSNLHTQEHTNNTRKYDKMIKKLNLKKYVKCRASVLNFFIYFFWDRVSVWSPGWPGTWCVDKSRLKLKRDPPASVFQALELKVCTLQMPYFYKNTLIDLYR